MIKTSSRLILKIAIVCTAIPDISQSTVTPALGSIQAAMPEVDVLLIQLLTTIASGCLAIFSPIYAKSTRYIKRRTLLYIGFILFIVGGLTPTWVHDIYWMLFFRFLAGLSAAIVMPFTVDYVVNFFEGREQRSMLGYSACITGIGATLFMTLGGFLANIQWNYCFLAELVAVPFFVFALIFLPEPKTPENKEHGETPPADKKLIRRGITRCAWIMIAFRILWEICTMVTNSSLSLMLIGEGLANTAQIGAVFSFSTLSSVVTAFLYERFYRLLGRKLMFATCLTGALGFFIFSIAYTLPLFYIGSALRGIAYGLFTPAMFNALSVTVPKASRTMSVSLGYTAQGTGALLSPFAFALLHSLTGTTQGRDTFQMAWIIILILSVFIMLYCVKFFKRDGSAKLITDDISG